MSRLVRAAALAALLAAPAAARAECAVALVLAVDTSSSVDFAEHKLQRSGLAAAFRDPAVQDAILYPEGNGAMATLFEWSGLEHQEVRLDWTWLGDRASILAFADAIDGLRRRFDHWPTALGRASGFAAKRFRELPADCLRHVVDVSGDGVNNEGVDPDWYRERGYFDGVTINGLVIRGAEPDPLPYYRRHVLHGPGAFVEVAEGYEDYPRAILRKLLRELQPPYAQAE